QLQAGGDLLGDGQRRARLPPLHLGEHRRAHPAPLGQVPQREVHSLAQAANPLAEGAAGVRGRGRPVGRRGRHAPYAITYDRTYSITEELRISAICAPQAVAVRSLYRPRRSVFVSRSVTR